MADLPLSSIASGEGDPRQRQQYEPWHCHEGRWILKHPPYSLDMSPCDYDLFAKMKEPLQGIQYNTREIIHAVGLSLLDINRSERADGVQCLPQIWQKVVHMGGGTIMLKEFKFVYLR
jgi:hypothetical protein